MPDDEDLITADDLTVADKWARDTWKVFAVAACIVALAVAITAVYIKGITDKGDLDAAQSKTLKCVSDWSDKYNARSDLLTRLSSPRNDALAGEIDNLNALLDTLPSKDTARITRAYQALTVAAHQFSAADDAYRVALENNPLPPSPKLACGVKSAPPRTPSPSPSK